MKARENKRTVSCDMRFGIALRYVPSSFAYHEAKFHCNKRNGKEMMNTGRISISRLSRVHWLMTTLEWYMESKQERTVIDIYGPS